jgi:hypothetical protein
VATFAPQLPRQALSARVSKRALSHDDRALAVDGVEQRLGDGGAHEFVVRREESQDIVIVSSGAISVSMSMTGIPASIILLTGAFRVPMPNA